MYVQRGKMPFEDRRRRWPSTNQEQQHQEETKSAKTAILDL
jgi:hypothetical protein